MQFWRVGSGIMLQELLSSLIGSHQVIVMKILGNLEIDLVSETLKKRLCFMLSIKYL